jgi:hypothetical protein
VDELARISARRATSWRVLSNVVFCRQKPLPIWT